MSDTVPGLGATPLAGRVAIVSGAAGLYGRHISDALAVAGAHVVLAARDVAACQAVADALAERRLSAEAASLDLASEESIVALTAGVTERHGRIDVLVNNAVARAGLDIPRTTAGDWDTTSAVNSRGLFLITREVGEVMVAAGSGSIVNIGSMYGMVGPDFGIYGSTGMTSPAFYAYDKGGMIGFTRYAASFYGRQGIRVNCLSPGGLETEDHNPEFLANYRARVPLGRLADHDDIKGPVVFLASDASRYITGANIPVDGGWTAI